MSEDTTARSRPNWRAIFATFLTTAVAGPPIGGFAMILYLMLSELFSFAHGRANILDVFHGMFLMLVISIPISYLMGGLSALGTAIALSIYSYFKHRPPLWLALVVATGMFSLFSLHHMNRGGEGTLIFLIPHLVAAYVSWHIVSMFWEE